MRLFLDTCVLFPVATRQIVLNYARAGGFTPFWSERVLEELRRSAAAKLPAKDAALAQGDAALLGAWFPDGLVTGWEPLEDELTPPDPADAHVIAAARRGKADGVLTFNIRDFPERMLAGVGLFRRHPDEFLRTALLQDGQRMEAALTPLADAAQAQGQSMRAFLKRANLPRLGKAWDQR